MPSARALTGGSRDLKPQLFTMSAEQSAADTATAETFVLPISRLRQVGRRTAVIEFLKLYVDLIADTPTEGVDLNIAFILSTNNATVSSYLAGISDPRTLAFARIVKQFTTSGVVSYASPIVIDLTDGAGNGVLVATDTITMSIISSGAGVAVNGTIKALYRITDVPLEEYVGIVQSQQ